jgi:hypothetical protein
VPAVRWLKASHHGKEMTLPCLFCCLGAIYVAVPALLLPGSELAVIQLRGWELMLTAFSFCVEEFPAAPLEHTWRRHAFLLMVSPVLMYSNRPQLEHPPKLCFKILARLACGAASLTAYGVLMVSVGVLFKAPPDPAGIDSPLAYGLFVSFFLLRIVGGYCAHSGRASIELSMLRLLGFSLPERYDFPIVATEPMDFWRRWNIYIGQWLRRYVFVPAARWWHSRLRGSTTAAKSFAIVVTFLATGLLHDYSLYLRSGRPTLGFTFALLLQSGGIFIWAAARMATAGVGVTPGPTFARRLVSATVGRVAFLNLLAWSLWLVVPPKTSADSVQETPMPRSLR